VRTLPIRWKVVLGTQAAVLVGLAVAAWLAIRWIEELELARVENSLAARTGLAVLALRPLLVQPLDHRAPLQAIAKELDRQALARVTVLAPDGTVLADSAVSDDRVATLENHRSRPEVVQALTTGRGTAIRRSETTGIRTFYLALPVSASSGPVHGIVRLGLPLTDVEAWIGRVKRALGVAYAAALLSCVLMSLLIARTLTRPLSEIAAVARQFAHGALRQRIQIRSTDEVGVLAAALNQMADQMDRDITALRRLEQVRKDFVANVSHELRTPLTSIKGYVEALLDGAKDNPEEAERFLRIILKQSDRLSLILEDLLQLSQIESGLVSFRMEPVHLAALVERTLPLIKPLADKKRQTLSAAVPRTLPPVAGDEDRLVQVLTNLLDNAIKYTPEGGTITVTAHLAALGRSQPAQIDLIVADTGIGIPEADRPRVFERFYRVDKARSRELGGTGLGLAIVKHIVEGHNGSVWVEANQPTGSRFIVRLPVIPEGDRNTSTLTGDRTSPTTLATPAQDRSPSLSAPRLAT
jgi:signal transduction histidine kinase